ncbi:MAG: flavocytochrome c [Coriobacteriales bacterium]|nr:flavocytochrome c [Coriobacteriales bacterium]
MRAQEKAKEKGKEVSRRTFVKKVAVGFAGITSLSIGAGCTQSQPGESEGITGSDTATILPDIWDRETDVLVLGGGGAGLCAAISAHDAGADVLVLEKFIACAGATSVSGGMCAGAGHRTQIKHGIEDSPEKFYEDWLIAGGKCNDPELLHPLTEMSGETINWLEDLGVELKDEVAVDGAGNNTPRAVYSMPYGTGQGWMTGLNAAAEERGIEILLETPAVKLYRNEIGRIVGAEAEDSSGKVMAVKAKKAVILATGGIANSLDKVKLYTPATKEIIEKATRFVTACWPTCTGDGIDMARAVDADIYMYAPYHACCSVPNNNSGDDGAALLVPAMFGVDGCIAVNQNGERFCNEMSTEDNVARDGAWNNQPGMVQYVIIDAVMAELPTTKGFVFDRIIQPWLKSGNNAVQKADSLDELATKTGMPPENLKATVEKWNGYMEQDFDPEFNRPSGYFGAGINVSPFYSVQIIPGVNMSKGGLRVNTKAQTLNSKYEVIPGLYSAGEVASGQIQGSARFHINGGGLQQAFSFGRIAGEAAASETPWE